MAILTEWERVIESYNVSRGGEGANRSIHAGGIEAKQNILNPLSEIDIIGFIDCIKEELKCSSFRLKYI